MRRMDHNSHLLHDSIHNVVIFSTAQYQIKMQSCHASHLLWLSLQTQYRVQLSQLEHRERWIRRGFSLPAPDLITSWPTPDYQDFITSKVCWLGCLQCRAVRLTIDHYRAHITSQLDTMLSTTRVSSHYNMLGNSSALSVSLFTWSHCLLRGSVTALQLWLHSASLTAESSAATAASPGSERPLWHSHLSWTVIRGNKLHNKPTMTRHLLWHSLTERGRPKLQDKIADIYFCLLSPVQARCGPCLTERTRLISRSTGPAAAGGERPWTKFGAWAL